MENGQNKTRPITDQTSFEVRGHLTNPIYWLRRIAKRGDVAKHIKNPKHWQRQQRQERPLPGRGKAGQRFSSTE